MSVSLKTPADVVEELRTRFRARRIKLNLTQEGLAKRSGVTIISLRRFEQKGVIALDSLLQLALVLNCLSDFDRVAAETEQSLIGRPLDIVLSEKRGRQKGRIK